MKGVFTSSIRAALPAILVLLGTAGCRDRLLPPEAPVSPSLPAGTRIFFTQRDVSWPNTQRVVSMRPDGSDRRVVADPGSLSSPPAQGMIAYATPENYGAVYVASLDGSNRRLIYAAGGTADAVVTGVGLSPTGTKVAFGTRDNVLHVIDVFGDHAFTLTETVGADKSDSVSLGGTPCFSPDGKYLAYYRYSWLHGQGIRYVDVAAETRDTQHDTSSAGRYGTTVSWSPDGSRAWLGVSWAPDGKHVSVPKYDEGIVHLVILTSLTGQDGSPIEVPPDWINSEQNELAPQWSPDGSRILFLSEASEKNSARLNGRITVYDVTTGRTTVVDSSWTTVAAFWSIGQ